MPEYQTYYDTLQISETASMEVIRGAFKYLSQKWHPDKNPDNRLEAEQVIKNLNTAYKVLSDPEARKRYDTWLKNRKDSIEMPDHHADDPDTIHVNIELSRKKINHFLFGQTNVHVNGWWGTMLELGIVVLMSIFGLSFIEDFVFNKLLNIDLMGYAFFEAIFKIGSVVFFVALLVIVVSGTAILIKKAFGLLSKIK